MTEVRGRSILGVLAYLKAEHAETPLRTIIDDLPASLHRVFDERIRRAPWYPYAAFVELLESAHRRFGNGDPAWIAEVGRFTLRRDAGSILAILRVFASVEALVNRGFGSWGTYLWSRHCSAGTVLLADRGEGFAAMGIEGFSGIAPIHCRLITGYLEEMGRRVGAANIELTHTSCVHRGDPRCEFRGVW